MSACLSESKTRRKIGDTDWGMTLLSSPLTLPALRVAPPGIE